MKKRSILGLVVIIAIFSGLIFYIFQYPINFFKWNLLIYSEDLWSKKPLGK
jgi:hypothetical protein